MRTTAEGRSATRPGAPGATSCSRPPDVSVRLQTIPPNRIEVAAILALIDKPWSRRELLGALEASDDQEKTADVRAALLESGGEKAREAVLAWEKRNPHENEVGSYLEIGGRRLGPFYTFGEVLLKSRAAWI